MAQQAGASSTSVHTQEVRTRQVRLGIWIELLTLLWMVLEAGIALSIGFITYSVSLQGFGIDSIIELIAGSILLWRLLVEQRGSSSEVVEQAERRAAWVTAISLFALAAYIVGDCILSLLTQSRSQPSVWYWTGSSSDHLHAPALARKTAHSKTYRQCGPQSRRSM